MTPHAELGASFDYLNALYHRPIRPPSEVGLKRIEYMLDRLGNPHTRFGSVHITGTCGKSSTATMIGSILRSAGCRTGLFRSPHMDTYRERIDVDGRMIGIEGWVEVFKRVRPLADAMEAGTANGYQLGMFHHSLR